MIQKRARSRSRSPSWPRSKQGEGEAEEDCSEVAGKSGREVSSGTSQCDGADKERLLAEARKVLRLRPVYQLDH